MLALVVCLSAEPVAQLHPSNYVNDFAGVLDAATAARLNDVAKQVDDKAHAQIAVVTVKSTDGQDITSYAVALYQKWGIGKKGSDRGVLILLAVQDRKYWTTVGYGLEPILPDGKVGGFGREAVPLLEERRLCRRRLADNVACGERHRSGCRRYAGRCAGSRGAGATRCAARRARDCGGDRIDPDRLPGDVGTFQSGPGRPWRWRSGFLSGLLWSILFSSLRGGRGGGSGGGSVGWWRIWRRRWRLRRFRRREYRWWRSGRKLVTSEE